jgi:hypothetical protein
MLILSGIRNPESGIGGLAALAHLAQAKLDQMFGLESAAGPAISLLKLDSKEVVGFFEFAIFYAGLAVFALELQRYNRIERNRFLYFEAGAGWRNIFQDSPLAAGGPEFRLPLNLYQVRTKLSIIFSSVISHD